MDRTGIAMLVAHNISQIMDQRGLNAAELARAASLNPTGIYDILSGKSKHPRLDTIAKIAGALGVPLSVLFEEKGQADLRADLIAALERLPADDRQKALAAIRAWAGLA